VSTTENYERKSRMASRYLADIQTNRWSRRNWELPWKL